MEGNEDSTDLIVFLQGWPDNWEMWDWINWKDELKDYRLLFINLPNTAGKVTHKWGVDFPQITENIKYTIDNIEGFSKIQKKMLVAHDWGCFYGYLVDEVVFVYISEISLVF